MKKNSERGGALEDVYGAPICCMFSGVSNNWDSRLTIKMKDIYKESSSTPILMFDFIGTQEGPQFLSQVIVELSKEL